MRKIDPQVYERLQARAAEHGVSMEEEVRQILRKAVVTPERLGQFALECFKGAGVELEPLPRTPHEPLDFGE